jgi:hypothetical protein
VTRSNTISFFSHIAFNPRRVVLRAHLQDRPGGHIVSQRDAPYGLGSREIWIKGQVHQPPLPGYRSRRACCKSRSDSAAHRVSCRRDARGAYGVQSTRARRRPLRLCRGPPGTIRACPSSTFLRGPGPLWAVAALSFGHKSARLGAAGLLFGLLAPAF